VKAARVRPHESENLTLLSRTNAGRPKIQAIQALRGVAVLAVVAFHSMVVERKYSDGDSLLPDWLRFGESGVDLFFVISGFVMVTVTRGRFGRIREVTRFVWSRITRIYPTYWFYFLLTLSVLMVKPNWVNTSLGGQSNLLASFLLLPTDGLPLVMVAWSLIHELWFYLVFAVLLLFSERTLLLSLSCWAAAVVGINLFLDFSSVPTLFEQTQLISRGGDHGLRWGEGK
jgi:exopolysaccharide production protein ExoZ